MSTFTDFTKNLGLIKHSSVELSQILYSAWMLQHPDTDPESVQKWDMDFKFDTNMYVLAGEVSVFESVKTVEVSKSVVENGITNKSDPAPWSIPEIETLTADPRCNAFIQDAFGFMHNQKEILAMVGNHSKIMLYPHSVQCPCCEINLVKWSVVFFGSLKNFPGEPKRAYHPGCFMREVAFESDIPGSATVVKPANTPMDYAVRSMGRTADEMRWRRRAKAKCHTGVHNLAGGQDPTIPERHKWRCKCKTAPWNLNKAQRVTTRELYKVKSK